MAKSNFTIEIKGVKEAFDKIKTNYDKVSKECEAELGAGVEKIVMNAKLLLPAQYNELRSSIRSKKIKDFEYRYGSNLDYAAYVEFGTGRYAAKYVPSLEPEWQALAESYKINGLGRLPDTPYLYPATKNGFHFILNRYKEIFKKL